MNLYDLVRRSDRSVQVEGGTVEAIRTPKPDATYGVIVPPATRLTLVKANEFHCLATFPRDVGWKLRSVPEGASHMETPASCKNPQVDLEVAIHSGDGYTTNLFSYSGPSDHAVDVVFTWPSWAGLVADFDLVISGSAEVPVRIVSGPVFDPRSALKPLLKGTGVEVGPGSNPFVKPDGKTEVRYVEAKPVEEWLKTYEKNDRPDPEDRLLWDRYIIGDAQLLDCCEDNSLDFIFSNHVFEHLMNPLGVLSNWSRKLRSGGAVVGVVPDCRYCFDLRQPPSSASDWQAELEGQMWSLSREKYDKWCRYTAPYNEVDDLIARNYSVHAHYYTPWTFRELVERSIAKGHFRNAFYNTSPNNKDFGFALWR